MAMTARGLRIVPDGELALPAPAPGTHQSEVPRPYPSRNGSGSVPIPRQPAVDVGCPPAPPLVRWAPSAQARQWTARAVCALGDPDRLFVTGAAQREAAKLCRGCPVQMECLVDALDNQIEFGVWGGLTERQRRALLKRRPDVTSWKAVLEQARTHAVKPVAS
jgi:WhiB family redox-sensing transcriptional regulator